MSGNVMPASDPHGLQLMSVSIKVIGNSSKTGGHGSLRADTDDAVSVWTILETRRLASSRLVSNHLPDWPVPSTIFPSLYIVCDDCKTIAPFRTRS